MNTAKILDVLPQAAAATPAPAVPQSRPEPRAVPPVATGATADMIDDAREQRIEREAAAAQERRRQAPKAAQPAPNLDREVGLVQDSFKVFVDLVNSGAGSYRVRIFGPPDHAGVSAPPTPTADPASARAAYGGGRAAPVPATVKADA